MNAHTKTRETLWHLLGAGNMGTLAVSRLLHAGYPVRALHPQAKLIERTLLRDGQDAESLRLDVDDSGQVTHLLLALKGPHTRPALEQLRPRLANNVVILSLQNGMGMLDDLSLPPDARVLHAVTTDGAWRDGDGNRIHVVAENTTVVGGQPHLPDSLQPLSQHWPGWQWQPDIAPAQWRKLAINAVINPLTAIHNCCNGDLLDGGARQAHLKMLAAEIDNVLPCWLPDWPGDTPALAEAVARQTAGNTSSMRADWLAGRETEIDFINGYLLRRARSEGTDLPAHEAVLAQLSRQQH